MNTRATLLREGAAALDAAGVEDPAREARLLLRWASGLEPAAFSIAVSEQPSADEITHWQEALSRRTAQEPLSHITGSRLFWGRAFEVNRDVLDPRPETEVLVGEALHRGPFQRTLDLGTGSGCILLTLLAEWPEATGVATDASDRALAVAVRNAASLDVDTRAEFLQASWWDGVSGSFDLIVSNPPYISASDMQTLSLEVRGHEPHMALTPGGDGLDAYRAIAAGVTGHLAPGGSVMVEIGPTQSHEVAELLEAAGLAVQAIVPDLDLRPRVVIAQS